MRNAYTTTQPLNHSTTQPPLSCVSFCLSFLPKAHTKGDKWAYSAADVEAWRAQRRKNYPSGANIVAKEEEEIDKVERGEIATVVEHRVRNRKGKVRRKKPSKVTLRFAEISVPCLFEYACFGHMAGAIQGTLPSNNHLTTHLVHSLCLPLPLSIPPLPPLSFSLSPPYHFCRLFADC